MRTLLTALSAVLAIPVCAQARVIWADDFDHLPLGVNVRPNTRFYASSGNDYTITEINSGANIAYPFISSQGYYEADLNQLSPALVFIDHLPATQASVSVPMSRFAPFDTSASADRLMRIRFEMGFSNFLGSTGLRFVIKPDNSSASNLILGFGAADILPTHSGQELFFFAANGGNADDITLQKSHALGLNAEGTAFETGFSFSYTPNDSTANKSVPPNSEYSFIVSLYSFDITFDGTTYNGTITRGTWDGQMTEDVSSFSITVPPVTLSSTDSRDHFFIETSNNAALRAFIDSIEFSVTPEPSSAVLLLGMAGLAMRRRHRPATL